MPPAPPSPWSVVPQYRSDALLDALFLLCVAYLSVTCVRELWCRRVARAVELAAPDGVGGAVEEVGATCGAASAVGEESPTCDAGEKKEEPPSYSDVGQC